MPDPKPALVKWLPARCLLRLLGVLCVVIGFVGLVIPGLPSTVFFLIAVWAFARSSPTMHAWLWHHPRFGKIIQAWSRDGIIPTRCKIYALLTMVCSAAFAYWGIDNQWVLAGVMVSLLLVALYIITRPAKVNPLIVPPPS